MGLHLGDTWEYGIHGRLEAVHTNGSEVARADTRLEQVPLCALVRVMGRGRSWMPRPWPCMVATRA
eukprot:scaffold34054_cov72-Phaeocystis_antarctica.AAC.3